MNGEGFAFNAFVSEAHASRFQRVASDEKIDWPKRKLDTRAVRRHLAAFDPEVIPVPKGFKVISLSDPTAAWTAKADKRVRFS